MPGRAELDTLKGFAEEAPAFLLALGTMVMFD